MEYSKFVNLYESLNSTTKKLEKAKILAEFLPSLKGHEDWIYLVKARVFAGGDNRELGVSTQLIIKAISKASGISSEQVLRSLKEIGDLGDVAYTLLQHNAQKGLFSKALTVEHVFSNLQKIPSIAGNGAVDIKVSIIVELISTGTPLEARYIIRTILGDLRIGVADALVLDAIVLAFFPGDKVLRESVQRTYDFMNDFSELLVRAFQGSSTFKNVTLVPGRPLNPMLAVKVMTIKEAFETCGSPCAFEHKYDGFRVIVTSDGKKIKLFTRRLEEVTIQFPDIISAIKNGVSAKTFIFDAEAVGYDFKKGIYLPFEAVSQRIKRKYGIDELALTMPVELNVFDVLYLDGETTIDMPFIERRALLQEIIKESPTHLRLSRQIVTNDSKEAELFYKEALKIGEEGVMVKKIDVPYQPGRYIGYMAKLKPTATDFDLVIVGGEYGSGKRAGGITSFIVACKDGEKFVEVGRVSSGLKEKASEGVTYVEIDALMQPHIIKEEGNTVYVTPLIVVSVNYQNIQPSPTYSSGYALRFPRITHYRPERGIKDIAELEDIKREFKKGLRNLGKKKTGE